MAYVIVLGFFASLFVVVMLVGVVVNKEEASILWDGLRRRYAAFQFTLFVRRLQARLLFNNVVRRRDFDLAVHFMAHTDPMVSLAILQDLVNLVRDSGATREQKAKADSTLRLVENRHRAVQSGHLRKVA